MKWTLDYCVPVALFAIACGVSLWLNDYFLYVVTIGAIFAVLAVSFDLLLGYTGYLSLAHGALYGVGAYCCGILTGWHGVPFIPSMLVAGLLTGLVGAVIALLAFRTKGLYFAVLTLGIGLIGHQLFLIATPLTGGIGGFIGIPSPDIPSWLPVRQVVYNSFLAFALLLVAYLIVRAFVRSRFGAACLAVREDITLAQALGIRIGWPRLAAFAISATFTGMAGALFAGLSNFIAPESFTVLGTGFELVALVVVGGLGTIWGPILGAILLTALPEALRVAATYSLLAYGALLLFFIIFYPRGIASILRGLWSRVAAFSGLKSGRASS